MAEQPCQYAGHWRRPRERRESGEAMFSKPIGKPGIKCLHGKMPQNFFWCFLYGQAVAASAPIVADLSA